MTSQKDPERPMEGNYMRRADGSWNLLPILAGALFVVFIGYMLLDRSPGPVDTKVANPAQTQGPQTPPPGK